MLKKKSAAVLLMTCCFMFGACADFEVEVPFPGAPLEADYQTCLGNTYVLNIVLWWDCLYAPPLDEAGKADRREACSRDSVQRMEGAHYGCVFLHEL